MSDLYARFVTQFENQFKPTTCWVVAYSGGLDSTVLMHLMMRFCRNNAHDVVAVHINHQLRTTANNDARFCEATARKLGVPFHLECVEVESSSGVQQNARIQRYSALTRACKAFDADVLLTAHHANDVIETAIINWTRGSGIQGLVSLNHKDVVSKGIEHHSAWSLAPVALSIHIMRPLLIFTRLELENYAKEFELDWREDPSNNKAIYTRNRVRHSVVPTLQEQAGGIEPLLITVNHLCDEANALQFYASKLAKDSEVFVPGYDAIAFDRIQLRESPRAVVAIMLREVLKDSPQFHFHQGFSRQALTTILDIIARNDDDHAVRHISIQGARVSIDADTLKITKSIGRGSRFLSDRCAFPVTINITKNGHVPWFGFQLSWTRRSVQRGDCDNLTDVAVFDADQLPNSLVVRCAKNGERMDVLGLNGHKRLTSIFSESHISSDRRWYWPCLATPTSCIWVCGLRQGKIGQITPDTTTVIEFRCEPSINCAMISQVLP